jgi:hypothetical protein
VRNLERKPLAWMDDAPIRVSVDRVIRASPEAIFAVLADHESWPDWFGGLVKAEVTGPATGVGATRSVEARGLGRLDEEFISWEPGASFGFSVVAMSRPIFKTLNELVTIEPTAEGAIVTYAQAFEPKAWARPLIKLAARGPFPKALRGALDGLAERAERQGS